MTALATALLAVNLLTIAYFAALNLIYTVLMLLGLRTVTSYVRRRPLMDIETISQSELTTPISIVIPAYDEGPVIVDSVKAMLDSGYPELEVLVINDGSGDDTLARLQAAYALVEVERVPRCALQTEPVRALHACPFDDRLLVIDKLNGGKADAINAGLRFARYPLFCTMDADTIVDADAFARLVRPFQAHPETVACGGIVRIANGCSVRGGEGRGRACAARVSRERPGHGVPACVPLRSHRVVAARRPARDLRERSACSDATSSSRPVAMTRRRSARTRRSSCACTATAASMADRIASSSSRTRCAGPRPRPTSARSAASATAGTEG